MVRLHRAALLALTATALGCAMPGKLSSEMQMPARSMDAARLRSIAVLRFDATGHQDITTDIESALTSAKIDGRPYFTVVERRRLDDAIREMRLGESGLVNPANAAKLGQAIAAKGIYMGAIVRDDVADQRYTETRKACAENKLERDKKGALYEGQCIRWTEVQVNCVRRSANFEFAPKVVDVERGTVVYSRSIATSDVQTGCQGDQIPLPLAQDMRRKVRVAAVQTFREDVAPYSKQIEIAYLTHTDGISSPAAKERFDGSISFAVGNRLDRACEIWIELERSEKASPSVVFNSGVCAEVGGDLNRALAFYNSADRLLTKPDRTVSSGLQRVRDRIAAQQKLGASEASIAPAPTADAQSSVRSTRPGTADSGTDTRAAAATAPAAKDSGSFTVTKDLIAQVQAKLNAAGYPVGTPDGVMGNRTRAALRKFQGVQRIPATGEVDAATVRALGLP